MKTITFDIETKPNQELIDICLSNLKAPKNIKDPEKIKANLDAQKAELVKKMSVDPDFCEIRCIGVKIDDEPAKIVSLQEFMDIINEQVKVKSELGSEYIERSLGWRLISFNGKKFDLQVVIRQGLREKISGPYRELKEMTRRFQSTKHIDLQEAINDNEWRSLDLYCQIYLGETKKPIDFETCSQGELEEHCLDDCEKSYKLYAFFKPMLI